MVWFERINHLQNWFLACSFRSLRVFSITEQTFSSRPNEIEFKVPKSTVIRDAIKIYLL